MSEPSAPNSCIYCGLPVPQPLWGAAHDDAYCCTGCRWAHAIAQESGEEGNVRWTLTKLGLSIFFSMNVMVLTIALWAYDVNVAGGSSTMAASLSELFRFTCLLLAFPVLVLLGQPILLQAIEQLQQRRWTTDVLIICGVLASYIYSTISVWGGEGPIYFEVGCMILVFVTLGRWLEATGKLQSTDALDRLEKLLPDRVLLLQRDLTRESVLRSELQVGDDVVVQSGDRIPVDGRVRWGQATVDEQLVSGESWPVDKSEGDQVIGGTLALEGELIVRIETRPEDATLPRLVAAVKAAREAQGDYQRLADRFSQMFIPLTFLIALLVVLFHGMVSGLMSGVLAGLAVILIACPCALGIATPMAIWAAIGVAAQRGVVFRSPKALEKFAKVKALRLDKTGTLTTGHPIVKEMVTVCCSSCGCRKDAPTNVKCLRMQRRDEREREISEDDIRRRAYQLARSSKHVFSRAIVDWMGDQVTELTIQPKSLAGKGVYGVAEGEFQPTALGNLRLMQELELDIPPRLQSAYDRSQAAGQPCVLIGWGGLVRGVFIFDETLREAALTMLASCRERGLDLGILTGDSAAAAGRLESQFRIPWQSSLTPADKQQIIHKLQREVGPVALIGDGVNDAPALSAADVGICLGCGADVSREAADICLIGNDLSQIPWLIDLSQATVATIRSNLTWAFAYNGVGILIATTGWLHPAIAAALMVGSSLFVIANSLHLRSRFSPADDILESVSTPLRKDGSNMSTSVQEEVSS